MTLDDALSPLLGGDRFHTLNGRCERHGEHDFLTVKSNPVWRCPECLLERASIDAANQALKDRKERFFRLAGFPEKYRGAAFVASTTAHRSTRGIAKLFFEGVLQREGWAVLLMTGEPGTGKTLMACELGQRLIEKGCMSVKYTTAMGLLGAIKASYGRDDSSEEMVIEDYATYDLLIIDEIDQQRCSENDRLLIGEVINRRYNSGRPMISISNQSRDTLAASVGDRVADRFAENCYAAVFDWPSFRRTKGAA